MDWRKIAAEFGFSTPTDALTIFPGTVIVSVLEAIFNSFLLVAATEMGDKTQLLAFILASRFRNPWAVLSGIFVATVLNHFLAAIFGSFIASLVSPQVLKWILGGIFLVFAIWVLIPDKDDSEAGKSHYGAFWTTVITFFLAEMGDKTQLSTVALAAQYKDVWLVTTGTTLGMMFSDGLAVVFGEKLTQKIPLSWMRRFSAILFVGFGIAIILS